MYIYSVTPSRENLKSILLMKKGFSLINCAVCFSLFFIAIVCEHGNENPSYHQKLGVSFSKATNLKGMSLSFCPQVTLCFAHLVSFPSYGWYYLQLKQTDQESQTGKGSCLPWKKKRSSRPKQVSSGRNFVYIPLSVVLGRWEFWPTEIYKYLWMYNQM